MLTIKQWADQFAAARARAPVELAQAVRVTAQAGAEVARGYIGHLQPSLTVGQPVPAHFPEWEPLAFRTINDKANLGFQPPDFSPLYRTGQMKGSIEGVSEGLTGAIVSDDHIMVFHEFGTSKMPPRPVLARALVAVMPMARGVLARTGRSLLKPVR